jgi:hypothetical protein
LMHCWNAAAVVAMGRILTGLVGWDIGQFLPYAGHFLTSRSGGWSIGPCARRGRGTGPISGSLGLLSL